MSNAILLPAIRSHVGDWNFYVTCLSFEEVANLIKGPDEVHERKQLSNWIQREAIDTHSEEISKYITENGQRFLGALIIGVYDGSPDWVPLNIDFSSNLLNVEEEQQNKIEGSLGLLHLSGNEKLFPIDGQHRVAGIKKALEGDDVDSIIKGDQINAIFVSHDASSDDGKQRTRRLFTTVNKKAKPISKAAIIALDEDNGFAIVTRRLIESYWLFEDDRKHISYSSATGSITAHDETAITSVVGLYEIINDLYPRSGKSKFASERPQEDELDEHLEFCISFLDLLLEKVNEYKQVFVDNISTANAFRSSGVNHMLFRPIGQRAFARAVQVLMSRDIGLEESIDILLQANMELNSDDWHHILWDPINNKMIINLVLAETQLLSLAGQQARNNQSGRKLRDFLDALINER